MKKKYNKIAILGVVLLLMAVGIAPPTHANVNGGPNACAVFSSAKNGPQADELPYKDCAYANDLHVEFHGKAEVQFTQDGRLVGAPQGAPPGANDFIVIWNPRTGEIKEFIWTKNGEKVGKADVPKGANDFLFRVKGKIVKAVWTIDGEPIKEIPVPKGANEIKWYSLNR